MNIDPIYASYSAGDHSRENDRQTPGLDTILKTAIYGVSTLSIGSAEADNTSQKNSHYPV